MVTRNAARVNDWFAMNRFPGSAGPPRWRPHSVAEDEPPAADVATDSGAAPRGWLLALGAALVPVFYANGGNQNTINIDADVRRPARNVPLGTSAASVFYNAVFVAKTYDCLISAALMAGALPHFYVMRRACPARLDGA